MTKLYVTNLTTLYPSDLGPGNTIRTATSDEILVKKTLFGYKEVFTNHPLTVKKILKINLGGPAYEYSYIVSDMDVLSALQQGKMQFVLDEDKCAFREAEEKDALTIIDSFEKTALSRYYENKAEKVEDAVSERQRVRASRKKAKQLVKTKKQEIKSR